MAEELVAELAPKDLLKFVEQKPERAIEVLREIIDVPDRVPQAELARQAVSPMWVGSTNTSTLLGNVFGQQQPGGFNG